ncbi:MAG: hypothetical protein ABW150_01610 [Candidatus Thiodiazotropha sp.]
MIKNNSDLLQKYKAKMPSPWQLCCPRCERNLNREGNIEKHIERKEWENKQNGKPIEAIRCGFCKKIITSEFQQWKEEGLIYE